MAVSAFLNLATDGADLGYNKALTDYHTAPAKSGDRRSFVAAFPSGDLVYDGVNRATFCRTYLNTDVFPNRAGMTVVNVSGDAALQAAITTAIASGTPTIIVVDHTVIYSGTYTFKNRVGDATPGGNNVVVLVSKAIYDSMPTGTWASTVCPPKVRTTLADTQTKMARFINPSLANQEQWMVDGATKGWRFIGIFLGMNPTATLLSRLARVGNGDNSIQDSAAKCPENVIWDRCGFDFNATGNIKCGIEMHAKSWAVQDCYFGDNIHHDGQDCQAIRIYNGPGPLRIVNNRVCASTENIMFGGASNIAGVPADGEIRWNLMEKLLSWNAAHPLYAGKQWSIKNIFETKNAQYLLIEGNLLRYSWAQSQTGAAMLLKDEFYGPNPGRTHDIIARFNQIESVAQVYNIAGVSGTPVDRVCCYGNVSECGAQYFAATASVIGIGLTNHLSILHETHVGLGPANDISQPGSSPNLSIEDTIFAITTSYGFKGQGLIEGTPTFDGLCVPYVFKKNALQSRPSGSYPPNNYFPATQAAVGFRDPANKDWALLGTTQGLPVSPPIPILPGQSIQAAVDANPAGTSFLLKTGTHLSQQVVPKTGDSFTGEVGTILDGQGLTQFAFKGWTGSAWVNNVTLRNFKIVNYNPPAQNGAVWGGNDLTNGTSGWIIDVLEVANNNNLGVRIGNSMQVLNSYLHHNGTVNIGGVGSNVLVDNVESAYGNATLAHDPGFESGGSKFVLTTGLIVRNSFFHHNGGVGLWLDINNINFLLENNRVEDNVREGIVNEIGYAGIIRNNTVRRNGNAGDPYRALGYLWNAGIGIHASSDVEVYGNIVEGNFNGIVAIEQARGAAFGDPAELYGPYIVKNLYVHDNVVTQNAVQAAGMLNVAAGVATDIVGNTAVFTTRNNRFVHNQYIIGPRAAPFAWQFALRTWAEWQGYGQDLTGTYDGSSSPTPVLTSITVAPATKVLNAGDTQQYTAAGVDQLGNPYTIAPVWSVVGGAGVGTITAGGLFTAGPTAGNYPNAIRAIVGSIVGQASVTVQVVVAPVLTSIVLTPVSASLIEGQTKQFVATGYDQYGLAIAFTPTWSVVAGGGTINSSGLFTAGGVVASFPNTVKASSGSVQGFASIVVTAQIPVLTSIVVSPVSTNLQTGGTQQFTAQGFDQTGKVMTISPVWSVVAGGSITPGGFYTAGGAAGTYSNSVKATVGGIFGTASVIVTAVLPPAPVLTSIVVSPATDALNSGDTQQYTAVGYDQNGAVMAINPLWSVTSGGGSITSGGLFTAGNTGGSFLNTIRAASGSVFGTASVTITPVFVPMLTSIVLTPAAVTLNTGDAQQFVATGYDQTNKPMPISPVWSVLGAIGTISPTGSFVAGSTGGTFSGAVRATVGSIVGAALVTINTPIPPPPPPPPPPAPVLTSIVVGPTTTTLDPGGVQQFAATGYDQNGHVIEFSPIWAVAASGGTISAAGLFTAGTIPGTYSNTIEVSSGTVKKTASVVINTPVTPPPPPPPPRRGICGYFSRRRKL